jgi:hypothetical protein
VFDGSKPVSSGKKSETEESNGLNPRAQHTSRMWMLEFSDNFEQQGVRVNILKVPQDPTTPGLRVGQSMSALVPALKTLKQYHFPGAMETSSGDEEDDRLVKDCFFVGKGRTVFFCQRENCVFVRENCFFCQGKLFLYRGRLFVRDLYFLSGNSFLPRTTSCQKENGKKLGSGTECSQHSTLTLHRLLFFLGLFFVVLAATAMACVP